MKLLQKKRYIMTDLGQAVSLHYTLEKKQQGYAITVTSRQGGQEERACAEDLKLNLFSAMRFYQLLIKDGVTPVELLDILESQPRQEQ